MTAPNARAHHTLPAKRLPIQSALRVIGLLVLLGLIAASGVLLSGYLAKKTPIIELSDVEIETVRSTPTERSIHGSGTLVAEERFHVATPLLGRVVEVDVKAGESVQAGTVVATLRSLETEQQAADVSWNLRIAESDLLNLKAQSQNQTVTHESELAQLRGQLRDATLRNDRDRLLFKQGLLLEYDYKLSTSAVADLADRIRYSIESGQALIESTAAQVKSKESAIKQLKGMVQLRQDQLDSLSVRAGRTGVIDQLLAQQGQQVPAGGDLAVIVEPTRLVASIAIAETQAAEVAIGQGVRVETQHGALPGHVIRIDASVTNGARIVDVRLSPPLTQPLMPNESVEGVIDVRARSGELYLARISTEGSSTESRTVSLFRITTSNSEAQRVKVVLGARIRDGVRVISGLEAGDRVIVSSFPEAEGFDAVRLK